MTSWGDGPLFCRACGALTPLRWTAIIWSWEGACCPQHPHLVQLEIGWCEEHWNPPPPPEAKEEWLDRLEAAGVDLFPGWGGAVERALERQHQS